MADHQRLDKLARYIAASVMAFADHARFEEVYYPVIADEEELADIWYELAAIAEHRVRDLLRANFNHEPGTEPPSITQRWIITARRQREL